MASVRYVFVGDQGRVFCRKDDPTVEDFEYAAVGMVTILRLADLSYYDGRKRKWCAILSGTVVAGELAGERTSQFHASTSRADEGASRI